MATDRSLDEILSTLYDRKTKPPEAFLRPERREESAIEGNGPLGRASPTDPPGTSRQREREQAES
ncbi:MAG TPA: hypothetical protein VM681_08595 [Candidatus Thermoplasmatota archaeon]|nr:hypothetical protein [Candidatus Thermoplasmatota archaeon]